MISSLMGLTLAFLGISVLFIPLFQRLGLGAVLGYLLAGVVLGPGVTGAVTNVEAISHFSEFGVVLLLFIIGLELDPKKLWSMRVSIFGLGALQVFVTAALSAAFVKLFGWSWVASIVAGLGFSLSSTAIVVQLMKEKGFLQTTGGQSGFSILLFQDIAVIPMMAVVPLLVGSQKSVEGQASNLPGWAVLLVLIALLIVGRFALRPILRFMAATRLREVFTAFSLLLVVGMAESMVLLGLSMGLGAFMAGVLLADSEYKHALETDIEPFKGLLLGLFFISVGMGLDVAQVLQAPLILLASVLGIVVLKMGVLLALGKVFKVPSNQLWYFMISMSQVGEFAFVLFGVSAQVGVFSEEQRGLLAAITAISMLTTPILSLVYIRWIEPRISQQAEKPEADQMEDAGHPVIIAGFGRFGQIVGRLMYASGIKATVLDYEPDQIDLLRRFGFKVYYGDATRLDLLESAGAQSARILVVAIDNVEESVKLVDLVKHHFPHLKIYCRARNVAHYYDLIERGIAGIDRETFESALSLGTKVLRGLGFGAHEAYRGANVFRRHNIEMLEELAKVRTDQAALVTKAKSAREDLEAMMEKERINRGEARAGWV